MPSCPWASNSWQRSLVHAGARNQKCCACSLAVLPFGASEPTTCCAMLESPASTCNAPTGARGALSPLRPAGRGAPGGAGGGGGTSSGSRAASWASM
eukprot:2619956-Alexandrium_andersonii.AAC.1